MTKEKDFVIVTFRNHKDFLWLALWPWFGNERNGFLRVERSESKMSMKARLLGSIFCIIGIFVLLSSCASTEENKRKAFLHYQLGVNYYLKGDLNNSLRELQKAEEFNEKDADLQNAMGLAYMSKGLYPEAVKHFRYAIRLQKDFPAAQNNLGIVLSKTGEWEKAIIHFEKATEDILYATPEFAWTNLGWAYCNAGQPKKALEALERSLAINPNFYLTHLRIGQVHLKAGSIKKAIQAMEQAQKFNADIILVHYQLGVAYYENREIKKAVKEFEIVLKGKDQKLQQRAQEYLQKLRPLDHM